MTAEAAGELDVLEATGDLAKGIAVDLAVLGGDDLRQLVAVCVDEVAE